MHYSTLIHDSNTRTGITLASTLQIHFQFQPTRQPVTLYTCFDTNQFKADIVTEARRKDVQEPNTLCSIRRTFRSPRNAFAAIEIV